MARRTGIASRRLARSAHLSNHAGSIRMRRLLSEKYAAWKAECEERFLQLKKNEEELNRIFIEIYGLQDELTVRRRRKERRHAPHLRYKRGHARGDVRLQLCAHHARRDRLAHLLCRRLYVWQIFFECGGARLRNLMGFQKTSVDLREKKCYIHMHRLKK